MDVLASIEAVGSKSGKTSASVVITDCGELKTRLLSSAPLASAGSMSGAQAVAPKRTKTSESHASSPAATSDAQPVPSQDAVPHATLDMFE